MGVRSKELVDINLTSGEVITATTNHPFWAVDTQQWIEAEKLNTATVLLNINDENSTIDSLRYYTEELNVYNLTIDNYHTYFVGVGGVLGHNCTYFYKGEKYDLADAPYNNDIFRDLKLPKLTKETKSNSKKMRKIDKIDELVELFGGRKNDWVKKKGWDEYGQEWHWYEKHGQIFGQKRAGEHDPFPFKGVE